MRNFFRRERGFTLVEVVVMASIITVLVGVALASFGEIKKGVRDKQRISDLEQIQLALRLYKNANGTYPDVPNEEVIGDGSGTVDTELTRYLVKIPKDPLSGTTNYEYVYDSNYDCRANGNGSDETVVYARTVEKESTKNWGAHPNVDGACEPNGQPNNSIYGIVLGSEVP